MWRVGAVNNQRFTSLPAVAESSRGNARPRAHHVPHRHQRQRLDLSHCARQRHLARDNDRLLHDAALAAPSQHQPTAVAVLPLPLQLLSRRHLAQCLHLPVGVVRARRRQRHEAQGAQQDDRRPTSQYHVQQLTQRRQDHFTTEQWRRQAIHSRQRLTHASHSDPDSPP